VTSEGEVRQRKSDGMVQVQMQREGKEEDKSKPCHKPNRQGGCLADTMGAIDDLSSNCGQRVASAVRHVRTSSTASTVQTPGGATSRPQNQGGPWQA